ncbi:hypothetical protein GLOIN_2v1884393 [Rhizophagus clarus]|uniref:Uncharacterized protein n=1 Tax=Rhizophagus clarus TaxID=94130 RepID=A0A8H3LLD3_9GLOM|nr:hypothetical protein GLOIN_2v1884393 [Rhizophagus clarus]
MMLPDEKRDRTFGIKCCRTKNMTGLLELREVLPDEKHDRTIGIKCLLPDEKHDRTIGIKCCRTKNVTGLLELSVAGRKARPDFWN